MNSAFYINLFSATVGIVMGVLLLSGIVLPGVELNTRLVLGLIFLSYGFYRYLQVYNKRKLIKRQEERDRMKQAQEDIIKKTK
ncbi:MAG: hypothetical protein ACOYN6_10055 [Ignavibacteria bacterium]